MCGHSFFYCSWSVKKYIENFSNSSVTISFEDKISIYLMDFCGFIIVVNSLCVKKGKYNLLEKKYVNIAGPLTRLDNIIQ